MQGWPVLATLLVFLPLWRIANTGAQPVMPLFWGILAVLGVWIGQRDRYLGICALYLVIRGVVTPAPLAFETVFAILAGMLLLLTARQTSERVRSWLIHLVVASGVIQLALSLLQWWAVPYVSAWIAGSIGNPAYLSSYLAIAGAVAPGFLLPVFIGGVILTRSVGGAVALAAALAVRYRRARLWILFGSLGIVVLTAWRHSLSPSNVWDAIYKRAAIWMIAGADQATSAISLVFGFGPGGWLRRFPLLQYNSRFAVSEIHGQAHNEFIQLAYEGGLVALVLLGLWIWSRRATLATSPILPAVVAAGVSALTIFPFQVAATAVLALTMLGFATQEAVR